MRNKLQFQKICLWLVTIIGLFLLWGNNIMRGDEAAIKEAKIDFVYVYGDEDSAIFRVVLIKTRKKVQIESIKCPLQTVLFKDDRWSYNKGNIPIQETEELFQKISTDRLNTLENFYSWKGTTAHHSALLQIYFRLENNEEFKKEIQIEDYPHRVKDIPVSLKEIVEIGKLLQEQTVYASEELYGDQGKRELGRNLREIDSVASGELKYFSSQALNVIQLDLPEN